jgi:organic radical activating enzyme
MESIYWVVSRDCNQKCPHCYNDSEPGAAGLTLDEASRCIDHLPEPDGVPLDRIILSGGEVLVWPDLLFHALDRLQQRYGRRVKLMVQTNGDLLDDAMLDRLLLAAVCRIDVASMDKFHPKVTLQRRPYLEGLFTSRGMVEANTIARGTDQSRTPTFAFWGATEDAWIGPLWPRGRAMQKHLSKAAPEHRFCADWSGAKGFLDYLKPGCEVNVQLADVYPCCPMTCRPLGCLLDESLIAMLDRCARHPVYQALNEGRPEAMGESLGVSEEEGYRRSRELGNHCLWCDEFFTKYAPDLLHAGGRTERGTADLLTLGVRLGKDRCTVVELFSRDAERTRAAERGLDAGLDTELDAGWTRSAT